MVAIRSLYWTRSIRGFIVSRLILADTLYGVIGAAPGGVRAAGPQAFARHERSSTQGILYVDSSWPGSPVFTGDSLHCDARQRRRAPALRCPSLTFSCEGTQFARSNPIGHDCLRLSRV